jgi:hypothetical protein
MAEESNKLEKEANERLKDARRWKEYVVLDLKECYFLAAPQRQRQISSQTAPGTQRMLDAPELYTDLAFILVADFLTEIFNTYMPEAQRWCERKAGMDVPADAWNQVKDIVAEGDAKIFDAMKASNLYSELPKAGNPDLAIAACALWVHRPLGYAPIEVMAVPMRELEINLGPNGEIDDRFVVRWARNVHVRKLVGEDVWKKIKAETRKGIEDKPGDRTEIRWGFWRLWEKDTDEFWQHTVQLSEKLVHDCEIKGEGCCPLIVMRFNPTADWPWAIGPMMQGLPTLRQVDEFERQIPEAVERAVNPATTFPDDSFTNVEQGIEPGMAYPIRPGTEGSVKAIHQQPTIEPELVDLERKEKRLRKLFFIDHPEQTGDTPPTLGQWLDELARAQRRIGAAGGSFWREGPRNIFLRFKYLLEMAGTVKRVTDKGGRAVSTQPYNPAQRAAEQQEIATATQCAQILAQMFPEEWRLWMDGKSTMEKFIEKMRTSGLLVMRKEADVQQALARITQLVQARHEPGAPSPPAAAGAAASAPAPA